MAPFATLLHVVALLSLAGTTRGDDVTPSSCIPAPKSDLGIYNTALRCVSMDRASLDHIHAIATLEDHKTFFKDLCDKKQEVSGCLSPVTYTSQTCGTELGHRFYLIFRDLLETLPDIVCADDGEILAKMFMTYNNSDTPSFKSDRFHDCVDSAVTRIVRLMDDAIAPHSRLFLSYRGAVNSKACFGEIDEGDVTLMKAIESLLGEVADKMKCMHPQEETPVLCKSIDVTRPGVARACPLKTLDAEKHPLEETLLLEGISWCLAPFLDEFSLNAIDRLESAWEFVVHGCSKREAVKKCMSEVVTLSSVCLGETQNKFVDLVADVLTPGLDSLCVVDGGYSVGYVVHKALSQAGATVRRNAITDCYTLAHPPREESRLHVDPADFLTFYRGLKVFKECLIKKMHGDNRAVFDALFFLSSVERKMKCLDPEHGTTVLCENADVSPATEVELCPLVGERETEQPTYERLLDMSILCLKAATVELDPVKRFTTLEQFRTFYKSFCPNRQDVKRCLGDVNSLSKACLTVGDHQLLTILNDLYEKALESGCQQGGEVFATVMDALVVDADHLRETCVNSTLGQLDKYVAETVSKRTVFHYQLLTNLSQCILNGASEEGAFKTTFTTFTNELLREVKCVHTDGATLVTCESFVHSR